MNLKKIFNTTNKSFLWINIFVSGFIILWVIQMNVFVVLASLKYYEYCPHLTSLYSASCFVFFITIIYHLLKDPATFLTKKRYDRSDLDPATSKIYLKRIDEYFQTNKPFLNPALSLTQIAETLEIPHRKLSQVINEAHNQNFNDFINSYRIKESQNLLREESNISKTILEICYEVGFNSKSTFNSAFKKFVGTSPKYYRNRMLFSNSITNNTKLYLKKGSKRSFESNILN